MQNFFNLEQTLTLPDSLTKLAYQTFQQSKTVFGVAHKSLSTQITKFFVPDALPSTQRLSPDILLKLQKRIEIILEADWQDAQKGVYPESLLFDNDWEEFLRHYPQVWLDMPSTWQRVAQKKYQEFSEGIETEGYPKYYLQNFHYQTDGYLGDDSANLYDLQVELLFSGLANVMRRRILAPLKTGVETRETSQVRVLDVACGTGQTLKGIRAALPKASLYGTDLSPAYLRKANQILSANLGELPQLLQANAEELPYLNDYFHGVTSVFLFHELPAEARQQVIEECFRVVKPGGVFVICDSIQSIDSPEFEPMMKNFPAMFHEPYYRHYIQDDLVKRLEKAGFENIQTDNYFVSKYWIAYKPSEN